MEAAKETKFGTKEYTHSTEKARDTTLDDEKYNVHNIRERRIDRTCVVVTALCNQPEDFAINLGDDQSCYLSYNGKFAHFPLTLSLCNIIYHFGEPPTY